MELHWRASLAADRHDEIAVGVVPAPGRERRLDVERPELIVREEELDDGVGSELRADELERAQVDRQRFQDVIDQRARELVTDAVYVRNLGAE